MLPRLEEAISLRYSKPNYNSSQQELIAKLKEHIEWLNGFDEIFWAVPMHNFGPGTHFKNYIDLLFNPGKKQTNIDFRKTDKERKKER